MDYSDAVDRAPSVAKDSTDTRPTKRNRITVACTWCRQRKSRVSDLMNQHPVVVRNNKDGEEDGAIWIALFSSPS